MKRGDNILSLLLLAFYGLMYFLTFQIRQPVYEGAMGAAFFPRLIIGVLAVLTLINLGKHFWLAAKASNNKVSSNKAGNNQVSFGTYLFNLVKDYKLIIFIFTVFAIYVLLLDILGYIVSTYLFLLVMALTLRPKENRFNKMPVVLISFLGATIFIGYLFQNVLQIWLPKGILF